MTLHLVFSFALLCWFFLFLLELLLLEYLKAQYWILLFSFYIHSIGDLIQCSGFKQIYILMRVKYFSPTQTSFLSSRLIHTTVCFIKKSTDSSNLINFCLNSMPIFPPPQPALPTFSNAVNGNPNLLVVQLTPLQSSQ